MSDLFFPQRIELRLDGTDYSPAVLERIVTVGGSAKSFAIAAKMFELLTDLNVSQRTINNKAIAIGCELKAARDAVTDEHLARPITQTPKVAQPAVSLGNGGRKGASPIGGGKSNGCEKFTGGGRFHGTKTKPKLGP